MEIALVLPFLLLLIMAILQFGAMYNTYEALTDAARTGAQELAIDQGLTDPCDPAVTQAMTSTAGDITLPASDVTPSFGLPAGTTGTDSNDYCGSSGGTPCTASQYKYENTCNSGGAEKAGDEATLTISYPYQITVLGLGVMNINLNTSASDYIQ
ncbi:MAG: TadE/TadG family type IV pilus assembly protein [Solirubrobacteraceae bacterium]